MASWQLLFMRLKLVASLLGFFLALALVAVPVGDAFSSYVGLHQFMAFCCLPWVFGGLCNGPPRHLGTLNPGAGFDRWLMLRSSWMGSGAVCAARMQTASSNGVLNSGSEMWISGIAIPLLDGLRDPSFLAPHISSPMPWAWLSLLLL